MKEKYTDIINRLSDRELLIQLYLTQLILLIVSALLGFFLFDTFADFQALFQWKDRNILLIGGIAGLAVVLVDILLMRFLPPSYYDDGGLNERIFSERSHFQIAMIALVVAFCEEILFRGIIQTHVGLVISSIIFALIHYRYLFNPFLFINVVTLSFLIGYIYQITGNLLVTISMHFIIDYLLGITIRFRKTKQEGMLHE